MLAIILHFINNLFPYYINKICAFPDKIICITTMKTPSFLYFIVNTFFILSRCLSIQSTLILVDVNLARFWPSRLCRPVFSLASAFFSFATTSLYAVDLLASSPANVGLYSSPKLANRVSVLIASLSLDVLSRFPISLYRRVSFKAPSSIIVSS
jgi:hypothetical protein